MSQLNPPRHRKGLGLPSPPTRRLMVRSMTRPGRYAHRTALSASARQSNEGRTYMLVPPGEPADRRT